MSTPDRPSSRPRALPLLLLLALLAVLAGAAPPDGAEQDWDSLFPASSALETRGLNLREVVADSPAGAWRIPLPEAPWLALPAQELEPGTRRLAGLVWPLGEGTVQVELLAHRLSVEVAAADWLLALLVRAGATVLLARPDLGAAGEVFEALALLPARPGQAQRLLARLSVQRRGQDLYLLRCLAPSPQFAGLAQAFAAATLGWRPPGLAGGDLVGTWPETCLAGGLCLRGPGQPRQQGGQAAWDLEQAGTVSGRLRAELSQGAAQAGRPAEERLRSVLAGLSREGLDLNWSLGGLNLNLPNLPGAACLYRGKAWRQGRDAELWALVWSDGQRQLCLWLVSVGQMSNMAAWMQNKRAFELAVRSLRLEDRR
ncbi:MAG: hypothetical protein HY794_06835 [Desulfarculus sp.]|nr:hypothetical protein [Desulfarculus sp.]